MVCAAASTALLQARARSVIAARTFAGCSPTRRDEQLRCFGPAQRHPRASDRLQGESARGRRAGPAAAVHRVRQARRGSVCLRRTSLRKQGLEGR